MWYILVSLCLLVQPCFSATKKTQTKEQKKANNKKTTAMSPSKQTVAKTPAPADTKAQPISRTIKVTNNISDKSLAYKYGFISYSPSSFGIQVNGSKVGQKETQHIATQDNKITVRYDYEFLGGKRKGAKEVVFNVPENLNELSLNFSWHDEFHVLIDNLNPSSMTKIY